MNQTIKKSEEPLGDCVCFPVDAIFTPSPDTLKRLKAAREALRASGKLLLDQGLSKARDESYGLRFGTDKC